MRVQAPRRALQQVLVNHAGLQQALNLAASVGKFTVLPPVQLCTPWKDLLQECAWQMLSGVAS